MEFDDDFVQPSTQSYSTEMWVMILLIVILFVVVIWLIVASSKSTCTTPPPTTAAATASAASSGGAARRSTTKKAPSLMGPASATPDQQQPQPLVPQGLAAGAPAPASNSTDGIVVSAPLNYGFYKGAVDRAEVEKERADRAAAASASGDNGVYGNSFDERPVKASKSGRTKPRPAQYGDNVRNFVKYGERFTIPGSNREHHLKAEKLLPKHEVKDPNSRLGKLHKKWLEKTKVPTRGQIKQAQRIQTEKYFNVVPPGIPKITGFDTRKALTKPSVPNMQFDQPILSQ